MLFVVLVVASWLSDSLAVLSAALNLLTDTIASIALLLCVKWARKPADDDHPFGHMRAEPVAGLIIAILAGILGFEVIQDAVLALYNNTIPEHIGSVAFIALAVVAFVKIFLFRYFRKKGIELQSPALRATAVDCRNDVIVITAALLGVIIAVAGLPALDRVAAILVGIYILYSAYEIGMENVDYLMGKIPEQPLMEEIHSRAESIQHILGIDDVKAHYVGNFIHVELTARVDGSISTAESHALAEAVRQSVESHPAVDRAFIHVEPSRTTPTDRGSSPLA